MNCNWHRQKLIQPSDITRAEVAALVRHLRHCPMCLSFAEGVEALLASQLTCKERARLKAEGDELHRQDLLDPEFCEVAYGKEGSQ